jgi:hypothetical protein
MIFLIGGAGRCGKSELAWKLHRELHLPVFFTDSIQKSVERIDSDSFKVSEAVEEFFDNTCFAISTPFIFEGHHIEFDFFERAKGKFSHRCFTLLIVGQPEKEIEEKINDIKNIPSTINNWIQGKSDCTIRKYAENSIINSKILRSKYEEKYECCDIVKFIDTSTNFCETLQNEVSRVCNN